MQKLLVIACLMFFSVFAGAADTAVLSAEEKAEGWQLLFNGQNLDGWRHVGASEDGSDTWLVRDGELILEPGNLGFLKMVWRHFAGKQTGDLMYYPRKFDHFELSLEWKISEDGNSGIFYLVDDVNGDNHWMSGPEMQVLDNQGHSDGAIESHRAGDLYDLKASSRDVSNGPGQWNQVLIRKQGSHVEHWLNAVKVLEYEYGGESWQQMIANSKFKDRPGYGQAKAGYIVFQDHGDRVRYRNIKARELPIASD